MRIIRIAKADCIDPYCVDSRPIHTPRNLLPGGLREDDVVNVVTPERSFKGHVVYKKGIPRDMVAVKPEAERGIVIVPVNSCTVNQGHRDRMENLRARREYQEMLADKEESDRHQGLYQDANP
jgi:hypothetical protein